MNVAKLVGQDNKLGQDRVTILHQSMAETIVKGRKLSPGTVVRMRVRVSTIETGYFTSFCLRDLLVIFRDILKYHIVSYYSI